MNKWLFLCVFLLSCTQRVVHFTTPNASFSSYHTYAIVHLKSPLGGSDKNEGSHLLSILETEIDNQMNRRNYSQNLKNPDLIVRHEIISAQETENLNNQSLYAQPIPLNSTVVNENYALLIELIDPNRAKIIWQASLDLKKFNSTKNKPLILTEAVNNLFNTYLYRAGSKQADPFLNTSKKK